MDRGHKIAKMMLMFLISLLFLYCSFVFPFIFYSDTWIYPAFSEHFWKVFVGFICIVLLKLKKIKYGYYN